MFVKIGFYAVSVVSGQSVACAYSDISFRVYGKRLYLLMRQSVLAVDVTEPHVAGTGVSECHERQ